MKTKEQKEQERVEAQLAKKFTLVFTQKELIVLHNILVSQTYKLGDLTIVWPIFQKIQAISAVETNIPPKVEESK